ncbi:MAG TPA: SRPBCC family protein [Acidimicrobiales bacterium]|jgi:uncharacterized protein YndB with AHSA1/START domain
MSGYDIVDEAVLDASTDTVWNAVLAEFRGARRWWVPWVTFKPGTASFDRVGGEVHATIHTRGETKRGLRLRFTARTRSVDPGRRLVADYVAGAFRGSGDFAVAPVEGGRTRLTMHWRAQPHGWVRVLAKVVDIGKEHSRTSQEALANLATVVAGKERVTQGGR